MRFSPGLELDTPAPIRSTNSMIIESRIHKLASDRESNDSHC